MNRRFESDQGAHGIFSLAASQGSGLQRRAPWGPRGRVFTAVFLVMLTACGPKGGGPLGEVSVREGKIVIVVAALPETVFESASHVLLQERIPLRRYEPDRGLIETGFIDLARYPAFFDREIWDETEQFMKLRFRGSRADSSTVFVCEPLYNPYEVRTGETEFGRLRLVPPGHPGFDIAVALTRRIAAHAEGRAVAAP